MEKFNTFMESQLKTKRFPCFILVIALGVICYLSLSFVQLYTLSFTETTIAERPIIAYRDSSATQSKYIFQIGCNRCGTLTIYYYFNDNRINGRSCQNNVAGVPQRISVLLFKNLLFNLGGDMTAEDSSAIPFNLGVINESISQINGPTRIGNDNWERSRLLYPMDIKTKYFGDFQGWLFYRWLDKSYSNSVFLWNYRFLRNYVKSKLRYNNGQIYNGFRNRYLRNTKLNSTQQINAVFKMWFDDWSFSSCDVLRYFMAKTETNNGNNNILILFDIETENATHLANKIKPYVSVKDSIQFKHSHKTSDSADYSDVVKEGLQIVNTDPKFQIRHNTALEEIQNHCDIDLIHHSYPYIIV